MREIIWLEKDWKFKLGGDTEKNAWYKGFRDSFGDWEEVRVPHDWSVRYPFTESESSGTGYVIGGVGWYRTSFELLPERGKRASITFEGVYNNAKVWINSNYLGKRPYGYAAVTYDITPFLSPDGKNVVAVQVNHTETADSRWFTGSGIVRPVYVTVTRMPYVEEYGVQVTTEYADAARAVIGINCRISGVGTAEHCVIDPDGAASAWVEGTRLEIPSPHLWSPDTPVLYRLLSRVTDAHGVITDETETRFGIRTIAFKPDTGFWLNGVNTKIKGVCVHHDAGCLGAAVPRLVWAHRLRELKGCGCNAIRTSHNPPDPSLLDLCDEMGFLVMDEAFDEWEMPKNKWWRGHNVNPPKLNGYYEEFPDWGERDVKMMVLRDRNHPSVILWSIGNEVDYPNDPYVHHQFDMMTGNNDVGKSETERRFHINRPNAERLTTIAKRLTAWVKECDTSRPVTAALAYPEMAAVIGYMQAVDVAGYNYMERLYEQHHRDFPGNVIYGSENGHSWEQWAAVRDKAYICGQFLWTGVDYLGEAHGWPVRASGAGLLTLAGFRKDRWYHRKAMWSGEAFAALFVRPVQSDGDKRWQPAFRHWNFDEGQRVSVLCYTNGEDAELYLNDEKIAAVRAEKGIADFGEMEYTAGILKVVCGEVSDALMTASAPTRLCVHTEADAGVMRLEIALTDEADRPVRHCALPVRVTVSGGALLGLENGNITDLTPYCADTRSTYEGELAAYVRYEDEARLRIQIDVPDMTPVTVGGCG